MSRLLAIARKEVIQLRRDPRSLVMGFVVPAFLTLMFGYVMNFDVKHLPLGVIDQDRTMTSRDLVSAYASSGYFVVTERLAACAQVQGPIRSTFRWQGQVDHATEWYLHCKTSLPCAPELMARLKSLHPYDVPEIVSIPIPAGHGPYLSWIEEMTRR